MMDDEQVQALARAIRGIAHGDVTGPTGLEMLTMALAEKGEPSISAQLADVACAIHRLADAVAALDLSGE